MRWIKRLFCNHEYIFYYKRVNNSKVEISHICKHCGLTKKPKGGIIMRKNEIDECSTCDFESNGACTCPSYERWYVCPYENKDLRRG